MLGIFGFGFDYFCLEDRKTTQQSEMKKLSLYIFLVLLMISACSEQNQLSECIEGDCNNGYGTYTWNTGDKYVGEYKDGKYHGQGTYTATDGTVIKGIRENGKLVELN